MYVKCNIQARSSNQCCIGKAMSITKPVCSFVDLDIQHEMRMRHIFISGLISSTKIFPHYLINGIIFGQGGGSYWTQNLCFDFLYIIL